MTNPVHAWYAAERATLKGSSRGGLMLGAAIWGRWYLDVFTDYCLPTILAPENRAALQGDVIAIYTDEASRARLEMNMTAARDAGIGVDIHTLPSRVIAASDRPFLCLAAAQQLLVTRAARAGMSFHPLMPDHGYSERYFHNLKRLGALHRNVAHGGINVARPPFTALERYRLGGGSIAVPARELASVGWEHTVMCAMNDTTPDRMPDEHYQVWRARDRVMLFNCYANPAYMPAQVCQLCDSPAVTSATLDCRTKDLFKADFYAPKVDDDMAFVALANTAQVRAINYTTMAKFLERGWREIGRDPELLAYYLRPTEMAAAIDEAAPTAEDVFVRQTAIVNEIRAAA